MADQTFQNVVNGKLIDSESGETYDVLDPTTGEVYAQAPMSGAEDIDRGVRRRRHGLRGLGRHARPPSGRRRCCKIADALEERADEFVEGRVEGHRQAARA